MDPVALRNDQITEQDKDILVEGARKMARQELASQTNQIICGDRQVPRYSGGIYFFGEPGINDIPAISKEQVRRLVEVEVLNLEENHNDSPAFQDYLDFMDKWDTNPDYRVLAIGHAVEPEREDFGVVLTGLVILGRPTPEVQLAFAETYRHADELTVENDGCRCWYD